MSIADNDPNAQNDKSRSQVDISSGIDDEALRQREEALLSELDDIEETNTLPKTDKADLNVLRAVVKAKIGAIAADNLAMKDRRDATRRAARRSSPEYKLELAEQRQAYADKIAAEEGREVRAYVKVPGKTRAEREQNAKDRDAARKRDERRNASQDQKDEEADKKWIARQRKKGVPEDQIASELEARKAARSKKRRLDRPNPSGYEDNPDFGAF